MYWAGKKVIAMLSTILVVGIITFLVFQVLPGDPAQSILGIEASPEALRALRAEMGLDRPLSARFIDWITGVFTLDFGVSYSFRESVLLLIGRSLSVTVSLALIGMVMAVIIAIPLGILAALRRGSLLDFCISAISQVGLAIPSFWAGILLILVFATTLRIFAAGEFVPWRENPILFLKSLTLPAIALALPRIAIITRITRTSMLDVLGDDYVRTARAKGLSEKVVVLRHALRNALIPIITVTGMLFASALAGAIVVEQVFALPGTGNLLLVSISRRDIPLVQGLVLFIAVAVVMVNFLTDVLYGQIDPRTKVSLE